MSIKHYIKFMKLAHHAYMHRVLTESHKTMTLDMPVVLSEIRGELGEQRTFLHCDCGNELTSTNSHIKHDEILKEHDYKCSYCGEESKWNFDIAPVAIRVDKIDRN